MRLYRVLFTTSDVVGNTTTMSTFVNISMLEKFTPYKVQVFATTIVEGIGSEVANVTTDEDGKCHC